MRQSGLLPTIRCSDCSAEIEISRMGDHICSSVPERRSRPFRGVDLDVDADPVPPPTASKRWRSESSGSGFSTRSSSSQSPSLGSPNLRPGRIPPPRIDPSAANRPFPPKDQLTPNSSGYLRSKSPNAPFDGRRAPLRSATSPLPRMESPPSPELSNLDCAFPPFPTINSPSLTPVDMQRTASNQTQAKSYRDQPEPSPLYAPPRPEPSPIYAPSQAESNSLYAPMSPKSADGGENVLQRLNTIAPGPFGVGKSRGRGEQSSGTAEALGHKRSATVSSNKSSKSYKTPPSERGESSHFQRPSTAGSDSTHSSVFSNTSGPRRADLDRTVPPLPTGQSPVAAEQTAEYGGFGPPITHEAQEPYQKPGSERHRLQTLPLHEGPSMTPAPSIPLPRRPTEPAVRAPQRRPTTSSSSRPNLKSDEPRFPFSRDTEPSPSEAHDRPAQFPPRRESRADQRDKRWPEKAPPLPAPNVTDEYTIGNPYHTPTESHSSSDSSFGSGGKTGSSRSSPPSLDVPQNVTRPADINNLMSAIQTSMKDFGPGPLPPAPLKEPRRPPRPAATQIPDLPQFAVPQYPESPLDPAVQDGFFKKPSSDSRSGSREVQKTEHLSPKKRPTAVVKGNCRGCGDAIRGKSVSSADGQLTGRYHKHCFVCKTCKEPFETATFYVHNNAPY
ncbi:MAG: hypothetical protein M1837_005451, partial [Sclerophora amabilis]